MAREISEKDWKLFRRLHPLALERFCERVLSEVGRLTADSGKGAHERYVTIFKLLQRRDKELAETFDVLRRSTAWQQLAAMRFRKLVTEEEFARFSPETREVVLLFLGG